MEILQLIPNILSGLNKTASAKIEPLLPIHENPNKKKFALVEVVVHDSYPYSFCCKDNKKRFNL